MTRSQRNRQNTTDPKHPVAGDRIARRTCWNKGAVVNLRTIVDWCVDGLAWLALIFVAATATATGLDVVLRQTVGSPIRGLVDLTQLAMMYAVFMSIAYGFARRAHVAVTVLTELFSQRANSILAVSWWLSATVLLAILSYAAFDQVRLVYTYGDVSQNIRIPMVWYWLPVVAGLAAAALGSLWAVAETLFGNVDQAG